MFVKLGKNMEVSEGPSLVRLAADRSYADGYIATKPTKSANEVPTIGCFVE